MKKIIWILTCTAFMLAGFNSCDDNNDGYYDNIPRIYFGADSLNYSFGDKIAEYNRHVFDYPVKMLGMKATREMKFKVEVDEEQSTARKDVHYAALQAEYSLLVDSVKAYIPIGLIRDQMPETDTSFRLVLKLTVSEDFQDGITEDQVAVLTINNFLEEPSWWKSMLTPDNYGPYQPGKYQRLIAYFGTPEKVASASYLEMMRAFKTQVYDYGQEHPEAGFIFPDYIWWPYE